MSMYNWIMDIHSYAYTIRYGYIHDSMIDIDNSITDYVWLSLMGENCGQGIGFHSIFNQWIQLIMFDKRVPNWKVGMD